MIENSTVTFEYSVDEAVDFNLRSLDTTKEGSSWRKREQRNFAIAFVLVIVCFFFFASPDRSLETAAGLAVLLIVGGTVGTILFGRYYDHQVKTRLRRLVVEQLRGPGPYTCTIEILPAGLRVAQPAVELTFSWRDATEIEDTAEGITVVFVGGRVLARTRGFSSQAHRDNFLASLREHVSSAVAGLNTPSN